MPYLFDTDAISELFKAKPAASYLHWIRTVPREDQFASAVSIGELYHGAFRSSHPDRHLHNIETRVLPAVTILPFDGAVAKVYGHVRSHLERVGKPLADADLQIGATALHHGLELVTGNVRHFERIDGLAVARVLADARGE